MKRVNLLFRNTKTAADRSIDVLSKLTAIKKGYATVYQSFQPVIY